MGTTVEEKTFGFKSPQNVDIISSGRCEDPDAKVHIMEVWKRVKKRHKYATFRWTDTFTIAIRLSPASICFDARLEWGGDAYVVYTVDTARARTVPWSQQRNYGIGWNEASFASVTSSAASAASKINKTASITTGMALARAIQSVVGPFTEGLASAKTALSKLTMDVFDGLGTRERAEYLLEYGLAEVEGRAVRSDVALQVQKLTNEYLQKQKDLCASAETCDGLTTLAIFKLCNDDLIYLHWDGETGTVSDVNALPHEVIAKLSVLQTTGQDGLSRINQSNWRIKGLAGVGAVYTETDLMCIEDAMCVYVSPETIKEVSAIAENQSV